LSGEWDSYQCLVDGNPASIFVDLCLARRAPIQPFQKLAHVRLFLEQPRPDGLSNQDEFETLCAIEDALTIASTEAKLAHYAGRNTSAGCRDFYFYVSDVEEWQRRTAAALAQFPDYRFETGDRDDKDWRVYFGFLYPTDEDKQRIGNRKVCKALENRGDNLSVAREVRHWACFPTIEARSSFVEKAKADGFHVLATDQTKEGRFSTIIARIDVPRQPSIDEVTIHLFNVAKASGGKYDGWETVARRA
jgi:hypothetical protein